MKNIPRNKEFLEKCELDWIRRYDLGSLYNRVHPPIDDDPKRLLKKIRELKFENDVLKCRMNAVERLLSKITGRSLPIILTSQELYDHDSS